MLLRLHAGIVGHFGVRRELQRNDKIFVRDEAIGESVSVAQYKGLISAIRIGRVKFDVVDGLVEKLDNPVIIGSGGMLNLYAKPVCRVAVGVDRVEAGAGFKLILVWLRGYLLDG